MKKDALKLFLSECTAISLKESAELEGGLSSTLQKRHKIRDTDLNSIFNKANNTYPESFDRWFLSVALIVYSGAAYKSIDGLIYSEKKQLGSAIVTPHWSNSSYYLEEIYEYEPMNLFPGWSLTNQRNNRHMLDPHYIFTSTSGLGTDLHGSIRSGNNTHTEGMKIANVLYKNDVDALTQRMDAGSARNRTRRLSAYSSHLIDKEELWKSNLNGIKSATSISGDRNSNITNFNKLIKELQDTTTAGNQHYIDLINSLTQQGFTTTDEVYINIDSARQNWTTNRQILIQEMEFFSKYYKYF